MLQLTDQQYNAVLTDTVVTQHVLTSVTDTTAVQSRTCCTVMTQQFAMHSATDTTAVQRTAHLYCCDPLEVNGVNPTMKKCRRGKGIRLTASFLKSEFSCPGNLRQHVMPDMTAEIR